MSALSINDMACFGRVSAFFGRASVFMSALSIGDAACFGRVSAFFGHASVLPALGRAFVLSPARCQPSSAWPPLKIWCMMRRSSAAA